MLIRLAFERFVNRGPRISQQEAVTSFFDTYIQDSFSQYDSHTWRLKYYWNEECDKVIKENMETLQEIFNMFAEPIRPSDPKVMRISNLINLITASGVCGEHFGEKEISMIWNL